MKIIFCDDSKHEITHDLPGSLYMLNKSSEVF